MKRSVLAGLIGCAILVATGGHARASAQTLTEGSLQIAVQLSDGSSVTRITMTLRDRATGSVRTMSAGDDGQFRALDLKPGEYDLTAEAFGLRPLRVEGIRVRAGERTYVEAPLSRSEDPNAPVEVRTLAAGSNARTQQFQAFELERLPLAGREVSSIVSLSTIASAAGDTEGLPAALGGLRVDGFSLGTPVRGGSPFNILPLSAFRQAEFLNVDADVEWSGTAAPALSVQSAPVGGRTEVKSYAAWLNGPARADGDLGSPVFKGLQAGVLLSGSLVRDTASFVMGLEFWRMDAPLAFGQRADSVTARAAGIARDEYGIDPGGDGVRLSEANAVSAFGRLEWRLGDVHTVRTSAAFSSLPRAFTAPATLDRVGARSELAGSDGYVNTVLASTFNESFGQEFRVGFDRSLRDYGAEAGAPFQETSTTFVQDAVTFGRDPAQQGRYSTSAFRVRETLHLRGGAHHVKAGFDTDFVSYDFASGANRTGLYWFGSTANFLAGNGYRVLTNGALASDFRMPHYGVFVQDEWTLGTRVRMLLGARWDLHSLPLGDVTPNPEWLRLTGINPDTAQARRGRLSPRVELEWQPSSSWAIRASGGIWESAPDALLFGEALANDGSMRVERGFGTLLDWPRDNVNPGRPGLTMLADGFQGPRSTRGVVQLSRSLKPGVDLVIGGTFRRTDFLPRRSDLNLATTRTARDQHNRDVYGALQQQGGLLAAASGSNRRFSAFDVVSAIGVDGWSEYRSAEASLDARLSNALQLRARYTYSKTDDNWFMARDAAGLGEISPFRTTGNADWTEGVSDFDVPHRALASLELTLPVLHSLRLATVYRYRSGYPFTPGFPPGVDANGDGSLRNDPAFLDAQAPGFSELASSWSCLQAGAGNFAVRNSCRAPAASALDARLSIGILGGTRQAELVIDGLNLIASGAEEVDRALFRIDPGQSLSGSTTSGQFTVPYQINPRFGTPLLRTSAFRTLRVGLRVTY